MVNNTSPETPIGRYTILSGQYGVDASNKYQLTISTPLVSQNYPTYVGRDESGNVQIWNPAGLGLPYITTAPLADNTSGRLIFVVLSQEPQARYAGYYYIILGA